MQTAATVLLLLFGVMIVLFNMLDERRYSKGRQKVILRNRRRRELKLIRAGRRVIHPARQNPHKRAREKKKRAA